MFFGAGGLDVPLRSYVSRWEDQHGREWVDPMIGSRYPREECAADGFPRVIFECDGPML